jgi:hypothetical protein
MTKVELNGEQVFVIRDFLPAEECEALIQRSEGMQYEPGTVADHVIEDVRNNERVILDDPVLAESLFSCARPHLPARLDGRDLVGFNERFRFYRYSPGQTFKPHRDGAHHRYEQLERSELTFMIYLNGEATGGETNFFADMRQAFERRPFLTVRPERGMALVFVHRIWHEGAVMRGGRKYVLRTDVMDGPPQRTPPGEPG